jgi:putative nucleotidyltransferase with HDIG domain
MEQPRQAEALVRRMAAAVRSSAIYGTEHPIAQRGVAGLARTVDEYLRHAHQVTVGFLGDDVLIERTRLRASANLQGLVRQFRDLKVEKISLSRGMRHEDMRDLVALISERTDRPFGERLSASGIRGVGVGLIEAEESSAETLGMAAARHLYTVVISAAEHAWDSALAGEDPDPDAARQIIDTLAAAVTRDRTSMVALTSIKTHDPYTFTHMTNVAILTMAQARSLGLNAELVKEFGLAGLMHDVGKVRVPTDILTKPGSLTNEERSIMQRHVIDGAQILRKTPGMPALAPVVAFEHHLRQDLSGYPEHIGTRKLNLCTMLVSIADVFDALRSNRAYRGGLPSDRVRAMLDEQSGHAFEPTLLRRFTSMMGLFPVGTLVRLTGGETGVVVQTHLTDVYHPMVRLVTDRAGYRVAEPAVVDTSLRGTDGEPLVDVLEALDPEQVGIDPLTAMTV